MLTCKVGMQDCEVQKQEYTKLYGILEEKLAQLNMVKGELAQISAWSKKRMARLRWQHAIAQVSTLRAMGHVDIPKPDPFAIVTLRDSPSDLLGQVCPCIAAATDWTLPTVVCCLIEKVMAMLEACLWQ